MFVWSLLTCFTVLTLLTFLTIFNFFTFFNFLTWSMEEDLQQIAGQGDDIHTTQIQMLRQIDWVSLRANLVKIITTLNSFNEEEKNLTFNTIYNYFSLNIRKWLIMRSNIYNINKIVSLKKVVQGLNSSSQIFLRPCFPGPEWL